MSDLFDLFNIEMPEPEPEKKRKAEKNKKEKPAKKETLYSLPITLNIGGKKEQFTSEEAGVEKVSLQELPALVEKKYAFLPVDIINIKIDNEVFFVSYQDTGSPKGKIAITDETKYLFGSFEIDIPHGEEDEIDVEVLQKEFKKTFGDYFDEKASEWNQIKILQSAKNNILVPVLPVIEPDSVNIAETITFLLPNREQVSFSSEEQIAVKNRNTSGLDIEEERAEDEEEPVTEDNSILSTEDIASLLERDNIYFGKFLSISKTGIQDTYSLWVKTLNTTVSISKEETFPVDEVTLSLLFAKYILHKADFNGKATVTKRELLDYIKVRHVEFEVAQNVMVMYDKKRNMILVIASGNKKGSQTPMFLTRNGEFHWLLKKIPLFLWQQGLLMCKLVYDKYRTEACLNLYYSTKTGNFFWFTPRQTVSATSVSLKTEGFFDSTDLSGIIRIGQFHSHGKLHAFFSSVDDNDEHIPGIYGVWGRLNTDTPEFLMRAAEGAYKFVPLAKETVFDNKMVPLEAYNEWHCTVGRNVSLASCPEEPTFKVAYINGKKVLFSNESNRYPIYYYNQCSNIYAFDLVKQFGNLKLAKGGHPYSLGTIISKEEIGNILELLDGNFQITDKALSIVEYCFYS